MVYDWDGKREVCYQMYIREKKALEEIMDYMKTNYSFAPRYDMSHLRCYYGGHPSQPF